MASVTFPEELGGNGQTYTDDADPTTGLDGLGYTIRFIPCLQQAVAMGLSAKNDAAASSSFKQQCQTLRQEVGEDHQAVSEDRAAVEEHLQDAQVRIGTTQALIDARDTALGAQAGAIDAEAGAVTAKAGAEAARDAAVVSGQVYPDTSAGLAATSDGEYFKTVAANQASFLTLWRNDAGVATEIETYPSLTGIAQALQQANRRQTRLARSLQRLGDHGQTLHSDFNLAAYGLGTALFGGVQDALDSGEMWDVECETPRLALQHTADGTLKYVEVPPNTLVREYNPETGQYQTQDPRAVTNLAFPSFGFSLSGSTTSLPSNVDVGPDVLYEYTESDQINNRFYVAGQNLTGPHTVTVLAKAKEDSEKRFVQLRGTSPSIAAVFDINEGVVWRTSSIGVQAKIRHIGSGVYECIATLEANDSLIVVGMNANDSITGGGYTGDGISGVLLGFVNLVEGAERRSLVVTEDAPVTRATDSISRALGAEFNRNQGSVFIECNPEYAGAPGFAFTLSGGDSSNYVGLVYLTWGGLQAPCFWRNGGVGFVSPDLPTALSYGSRIKALLSWEGKNVVYVINGQTLFDGISNAAMPDVFEERLNGRLSADDFPTNGTTTAHWISPDVTTLAEAQALTAIEGV